MHELSLSSAIVDTVVRHAAARRVLRVDLRIGSLRQVVPDSLAFYFEIVGRDTVCDGATLELELVEALLRCRRCGGEWDPAPPPIASDPGDPVAFAHAGLPGIPSFRCPECGEGGGDVVRGDELEVESIEVEEPGPDASPPTSEEEPCIAPR